MWQTNRASYAFSESGFAVFFSPVRSSPRLLIVGFNPGGVPANFELARAREVPTEHDYFAYDYPMARRMRSLFTRIGLEGTLRQSVKTNIVFFRSATKNEWASAPAATRVRLEEFCETKVREMIEHLRPGAILCEGIDTFDRVAKAIGGANSLIDEFTAGGKRRVHCRFAYAIRATLIGMLHPTGARPSVDELEVIAGLLAEDLGGQVADSFDLAGIPRVAASIRRAHSPRTTKKEGPSAIGAVSGSLRSLSSSQSCLSFPHRLINRGRTIALQG